MALRGVLRMGHPQLRRRANEVERLDDDTLPALVEDMLETMKRLRRSRARRTSDRCAAVHHRLRGRREPPLSGRRSRPPDRPHESRDRALRAKPCVQSGRVASAFRGCAAWFRDTSGSTTGGWMPTAGRSRERRRGFTRASSSMNATISTGSSIPTGSRSGRCSASSRNFRPRPDPRRAPAGISEKTPIRRASESSAVAPSLPARQPSAPPAALRPVARASPASRPRIRGTSRINDPAQSGR